MSKAVTSNEGSRKKKDLLSQYPYKTLGTNCIIFDPGERQVQSNKEGTIDISWLEDLDNVMTVPIVGNIKEIYDEIPTEKGSMRRNTRKLDEKVKRTAKSKTESKEKSGKSTARKSGQRDSEEAR